MIITASHFARWMNLPTEKARRVSCLDDKGSLLYIVSHSWTHYQGSLNSKGLSGGPLQRYSHILLSHSL